MLDGDVCDIDDVIELMSDRDIAHGEALEEDCIRNITSEDRQKRQMFIKMFSPLIIKQLSHKKE
jgi:hypothetical protein